MKVEFDFRAGKILAPKITSLLTDVVTATLASEGAPEESAVSIRLVGERAIRRANAEFRGLDRVTDVLSFPLLAYDEPAVFPTLQEDPMAYDPETGALCLGDVLLCLPRAKAQAARYGHSLRRELAFLTAHSILHLCGYDHEEASEATRMEEKQEAILQSLGIVRGDNDE